MRRVAATIFAVCLLLLGTASMAAAAPSYPPAQPGTIAVTANIVPPGQTVGIRLTSWLPGEPVAVSISSPPASSQPAPSVSVSTSNDGFEVTVNGSNLPRVAPRALRAAITVTCVPGGTCHPVADASGFASGRVTFQRLGTYTLTAVGTSMDGTPRTVSTQVRVVPEALVSGADANGSGNGGNGLPRTGGDDRTPLYFMLGIGLIMIGSAAVVFARRRHANRISA